MATKTSIVELNVGGKVYMTNEQTLQPSSVLTKEQTIGQKDNDGRLFIDRDPDTFANVLQFLRDLRSHTSKFDCNHWLGCLPSKEQALLLNEAHYLEIKELQEALTKVAIPFEIATGHNYLNQLSKMEGLARCHSDNELLQNDQIVSGLAGPSFISLGYRVTHTLSRGDNISDKFRRINRITVAGRAKVAKEVFQDDINDSRDPDRHPSDGYTSRYYLKHNILEKACEQLVRHRFALVTSCSSGAKTLNSDNDLGVKQWTSFIEYMFCRHI